MESPIRDRFVKFGQDALEKRKKEDERHRIIQDLGMVHQKIPPSFYMQA